MENVISVDELGKNIEKIAPTEISKAGTFLKELNGVLTTLKDITGINLADEIKQLRESQTKNLASSDTATHKQENPIQPSKLSLDIAGAKEDLIAKINLLDDNMKVSQVKLNLKTLNDSGMLDSVIEKWIKQFTIKS